MTQTGKQTKREEGRCGQRNGVDTRKDKESMEERKRRKDEERYEEEEGKEKDCEKE